MRGKKFLLAAAAALVLVACGGGGGVDRPEATLLAQAPQQAPARMAAEATPVQLYLAFYGVAPANPTYTGYWATQQASGPEAVALTLASQFSSTGNATLATTVLTNMGVTAASTNSAAYAALSQALAQIFAVYPSHRGIVVLNLVNLLKDLEDNATYGAAARAFNSSTVAAYEYATNTANVTPAGPMLSGVAAKGPLRNAAVGVYNLNSDGSKGALLANGTTAADGTGRFSVALPSRPAGGVLIEVTGGTYTSAYDGATVASQKISAMLGSVSPAGESGLSINPLTDMSIALTRDYVSQNYPLAASLASADKWVSWSFGMKTAPTRIVPIFDATQAPTDPEAVHLALVLAALDTLGKRLSPANPDAIFASLSADFADGFFDGYTRSGRVTLNGSAIAVSTGTTEFLKAFAVTMTGTAAGWRPAYLDAHFRAGTVVENYQARIIPVYVAAELAAYFPRTLTTPLPKTTSLDARATGYSCASGAQLSFTASGTAVCGQGAYYSCAGAVLVTSGSSVSCSDGGIPFFHVAEPAVFTAPTLVPYSASTMTPYLAATTIGEPSSGTIPVFRAAAAHLLTQAERDAMLANDRAAGDAAAARVSGLGVPNALQLEWLGKIGDAMLASVGH
jgi:hypothetical protein